MRPLSKSSAVRSRPWPVPDIPPAFGKQPTWHYGKGRGPTDAARPASGWTGAGRAGGRGRIPRPGPLVTSSRARRPGQRWWRRRYWVAAGVVVAVVLLAATSLAVSLHALSKPTLSAGAVNATVNSEGWQCRSTASRSQPPAGVVVYNQVAPAMVVIQASIPGARSEESLGAGVIVSNTGEILTALHVVEGATSIKVCFLRRHHIGGDHPLVRRQPRHRVAHAQASARRRGTRRARRRRSDRRPGVRRRSPAGPGRHPHGRAWSPASTAPSRAPTAGP